MLEKHQDLLFLWKKTEKGLFWIKNVRDWRGLGNEGSAVFYWRKKGERIEIPTLNSQCTIKFHQSSGICGIVPTGQWKGAPLQPGQPAVLHRMY